MVYEKPTVLIVDDEEVVCDVLYDELNERGYLCTTALDGNDALTKLAAQDFNVILLDIKLPGVSGMEVLKRIRSNRHSTHVIMITAVNNVDTVVEAMKLGAVDYIVKPFDLDRVNTSIHTALETDRRLPGKRDYERPRCVGGEVENEQTTEESSKEMNAIAFGVEVKQDFLDDHSEIVTQRTIDLAQQLGIPEKEIQRWVAARQMLDSERKRVIASSLNKLERSPLAQEIMGILVPYPCIPKPDGSQN